MSSRRAAWLLATCAAAAPAPPAVALDPAKPLDLLGHALWDTATGLPQNSAEALLQTRDRHIWIGTQEGLARFDGLRFTLFDSDNTPALRNNHVSALLESREGPLWAGTWGGGAVRFGPGAAEAFTTAEGLPDDRVVAFAQEPVGTLWAATASGLARLEGSRFVAVSPPDGRPLQVRAFLADHEGTLWVGCVDGLWRLARGVWTSHPPRGSAPMQVDALAEDAQRRIIVGTAAGLSAVAGDATVPFGPAGGASRSAMRALMVDARGVLWIGTSQGLRRLAGGRLEPLATPLGRERSDVVSLLEDHEGSLWFGTKGHGLHQLKEGSIVTWPASRGLPDDQGYDVVAGSRDGGLWIGGVDPGRVWRLESGRAAVWPVKYEGQLRTLLEGSDGSLWMGGDRGVVRSHGGRTTAFTTRSGLPVDSVRALGEDASGDIWAGTDGGGVVRIGPRGVRVYGAAQGLVGPEVRAVLRDRKGTLWVGTYGGLNRLVGDRFEAFKPVAGPTPTLVRCLMEDAEGVLWAGTYGGGLLRVRDGRVAVARRRDGLLRDAIYQVVEDRHQHLWLTSNGGLCRVAKADLAAFFDGRIPRIPAEAFGEADGMKSRECNGGSPGGWATPDGTLWFPTLKGVVQVDPSRLAGTRVSPRAVLTQVLAEGAAREPDGSYRLPSDSRTLEFQFAAPSFLAPDKVRLRFRLEGIDDAWREAGPRRIAYYTHLPPGSYRFRVAASLGDGQWSDQPALTTVHLSPRFVETWAFKALIVVDLIVAGLLVLEWRTRWLRREGKRLKERVDAALAEIKVLSGLLPVCAWCRKVRDDQGAWYSLEQYVQHHSDTSFTHGICPACKASLRSQQAAKDPPLPL